MTIAQAFNEITEAQGGTPNNGGTIAGAIDALNDTLAGSDQQPAQTIEGAIRLLGAHIGGGVAPSGTIEITENGEGIDVAQYAYADVNVSGSSMEMATLTIDNKTASTPFVFVPNIAYGKLYCVALVESNTVTTNDIPLEETGTQLYAAFDGLTGTMSGDYEALGDGFYFITGNATLTITTA